MLARFDVPAAGCVVNRVIPHELLDQNITECLRRRIAMQEQHVGEMRKALGDQALARWNLLDLLYLDKNFVLLA